MTTAQSSARLCRGFAYVAHTLMHLLAGLYVTLVLPLEQDWGIGYEDLLRLWTLGALLIGLGAPLAGWLGDRWSESRMMVLFYGLTGGGSVAAGLATTPEALTLALAVLGLGAGIYHPVGTAWVLRNSDSPGRSMGIFGLFGSIGVGTAALVAGVLSDLIHWRAAFLLPGGLTLALGGLLALAIASGRVVDREHDLRAAPPPSRTEAARAFVLLSVTMLCGGLIFGSVQTLLPKWFGLAFAAWSGSGTGAGITTIGALITVVSLTASLAQVWGGRLADRASLKHAYILCQGVQIPLMLLAMTASSWPVLPLAIGMAVINNIQLTVENVLIARFTPQRLRGTAFGAKFILTFGAAPLAVQLVAWGWESMGRFAGVFAALAALAGIALLAACALPATPPRAAAPQPL